MDVFICDVGGRGGPAQNATPGGGRAETESERSESDPGAT